MTSTTMTDEQARAVAYEWHGGAGSPLYQFASTGMTANKYGLLAEIEGNIAWCKDHPFYPEAADLDRLVALRGVCEGLNEWTNDIIHEHGRGLPLSAWADTERGDRLDWTETDRATRGDRVTFLESIATHQDTRYSLTYSAYDGWSEVWIGNETTDEVLIAETFGCDSEGPAIARYHELRDTLAAEPFTLETL